MLGVKTPENVPSPAPTGRLVSRVVLCSSTLESHPRRARGRAAQGDGTRSHASLEEAPAQATPVAEELAVEDFSEPDRGGQPSLDLVDPFATQTVSGWETSVSVRFYEICLRQTTHETK